MKSERTHHAGASRSTCFCFLGSCRRNLCNIKQRTHEDAGPPQAFEDSVDRRRGRASWLRETTGLACSASFLVCLLQFFFADAAGAATTRGIPIPIRSDHGTGTRRRTVVPPPRLAHASKNEDDPSPPRLAHHASKNEDANDEDELVNPPRRVLSRCSTSYQQDSSSTEEDHSKRFWPRERKIWALTGWGLSTNATSATVWHWLDHYQNQLEMDPANFIILLFSRSRQRVLEFTERLCRHEEEEDEVAVGGQVVEGGERIPLSKVHQRKKGVTNNLFVDYTPYTVGRMTASRFYLLDFVGVQPQDWILQADGDELAMFPGMIVPRPSRGPVVPPEQSGGSRRTPLVDLVDNLDINGENAMFSLLVERIAGDGNLEKQVEPLYSTTQQSRSETSISDSSTKVSTASPQQVERTKNTLFAQYPLTCALQLLMIAADPLKMILFKGTLRSAGHDVFGKVMAGFFPREHLPLQWVEERAWLNAEDNVEGSEPEDQQIDGATTTGATEESSSTTGKKRWKYVLVHGSEETTAQIDAVSRSGTAQGREHILEYVERITPGKAYAETGYHLYTTLPEDYTEDMQPKEHDDLQGLLGQHLPSRPETYIVIPTPTIGGGHTLLLPRRGMEGIFSEESSPYDLAGSRIMSDRGIGGKRRKRKITTITDQEASTTTRSDQQGNVLPPALCSQRLNVRRKSSSAAPSSSSQDDWRCHWSQHRYARNVFWEERYLSKGADAINWADIQSAAMLGKGPGRKLLTDLIRRNINNVTLQSTKDHDPLAFVEEQHDRKRSANSSASVSEQKLRSKARIVPSWMDMMTNPYVPYDATRPAAIRKPAEGLREGRQGSRRSRSLIPFIRPYPGMVMLFHFKWTQGAAVKHSYLTTKDGLYSEFSNAGLGSTGTTRLTKWDRELLCLKRHQEQQDQDEQDFGRLSMAQKLQFFSESPDTDKILALHGFRGSDNGTIGDAILENHLLRLFVLGWGREMNKWQRVSF
ncbi:unnamed protein product [Amoebophrya sp. A25]|nr:unnamed protein product [Amoebophrya sp. A25]|eukprot:GSA25T00015513001.1